MHIWTAHPKKKKMLKLAAFKTLTSGLRIVILFVPTGNLKVETLECFKFGLNKAHSNEQVPGLVSCTSIGVCV